MAELQFPNIVGQYQQGYDRGRGQLADRLAGQAFGAQGGERQSLLGKLAGVNPQAAMVMDSRFQQQGAAQQEQAQAQEVDHAKKLNGAARYMLAAVQSGDPNRVQGSWQSVRPYLAELTGKEPPQQFDPAMLPKIYEIVGNTGGEPDQKGTVVTPGGVLVNPSTGEQMFANPANPANGQIVKVPDGRGGTIDMIFDPRTRQLTQPNYGQPQGQPQGPDLDAINAQASQMVNSGQLTPEQGDAWIKQQYANAGMQMDTQAPQGVGGLGYAPPKANQSAPAGYRFAADGTSLEPIPGGPADKAGASSVTLGDPTKTGNEFLSSIPDPTMRQLVQAVAEGRMPLPKIYRAGKAGEIGPTQIAQAVAQYDPTYDQADPNSRIRARADFTSGKAALEIQRLNTLAGHLLGLADATDKLNNSNFSTDYNAIANNLVTRGGSTVVTNFNQAAQPAAEEFAAIMKGSGAAPTEQEIQLQQKNLDAKLGPEQLHGVIGTMAAQVQSRLEALNERAANGLGPFAKKVTIVTPDGRKALDALRQRGLIPSFHIGGNEGAPSGVQAGQVEDGYRFKGGDPADPASWEKA